MIVDWIVLLLLLVLFLGFIAPGKRKSDRPMVNKARFYLRDVVFSMLVIVLFVVLKTSAFYPLAFRATDKGIMVGEEVMIIFFSVMTVPLFLSMTPWSDLYPKDIASAKELFGFPVKYLPNTGREFGIFTLYIINGVIFEELIARQLMFHILHSTLHLNGDALVVISALLFAVLHVYQGWKGVLSNFVVGLILGKIFLLQEDLLYPIVLHLALNLTLVVLAFRRWRDLRPKTVGE